MIELRFVGGTVEARELPEELAAALPGCVWDARTHCHRVPALEYASLVLAMHRAKLDYADDARRYERLERPPRLRHAARDYQKAAVAAWRKQMGRGLVVLPTGAGKTQVGLMAIHAVRRTTLVVAPTLDLVRQWHGLLSAAFAGDVGVVGGGEHDVRPVTVTTYDSAFIHMEHLGARFGLVIFDEAHHLPGESYALAARQCLAPFRLGLTATPERADGREELLEELVGPTAYRQDIVDLSGDYLAEYETRRITVELSPEERAEYEAERGIYKQFLRAHGIRMADPSGWSRFMMFSVRNEEGRRAMQAYRRQRELAFTAPAKLDTVAQLLHRHRRDRAILFTQDNATAYALSRRFLIPAITHQTKVSERSEILEGLHAGRYHAVVTSKVLNEGVDVPAANVAIVVSGSGSVREHVQRLGRVLRKHPEKNAVLYELVTAQTTEHFTSQRRREHVAYR